jgi:hypothetical protein
LKSSTQNERRKESEVPLSNAKAFMFLQTLLGNAHVLLLGRRLQSMKFDVSSKDGVSELKVR